MKKVYILYAVIAIVSFVLFACKKEQSSNGNQSPQINVPATAKVGQTVSLSAHGAAANSVARWSISPNSGFRMDSTYSFGNNAVTFSQPGMYQLSITMAQLNNRPDSIPQPPHSDSTWNPRDSTYYPPYYPPVDSTWYHYKDSCFHAFDSSYHHSRDSVHYTRTIVVTR